MTRAPLLVAVVAWLFGGELLAAALYWGFLNAPESNSAMLIASALLALSVAVVLAFTVSAAAFALREGGWSSRLIRRAVRSVPLFWLSCVPAALLWWGPRAAQGWLTDHSSEVTAWFIAAFGWSDVSLLFTAAAFLRAWLGWVVGPTLSLALFIRLTGAPGASLAAFASSWRAVGLATLWFLVLIVLPWQFVSWRPRQLPATWLDPAVAGVRLLVVGVAMTFGVALMIRAITTDRVLTAR